MEIHETIFIIMIQQFLPIKAMCEEIIEHILEDAFQFDRSSLLVREEDNLSHQPSPQLETNSSKTDVQPQSHKASSHHQNNAQRKSSLRLRCLA